MYIVYFFNIKFETLLIIYFWLKYGFGLCKYVLFWF